jgi:thiamine-phosphate diphosphorylase
VLLVQRAKEPNRGRWSYPGGRIEPGETARQAAAREALEETGIRVRVLDLVDVYDAIFPPFHYCVADYLAAPEAEVELSPGGDAMDARWVPFDELHRYEPTDAMRTVLERARWIRSVGSEAPPCLGLDPEPAPPAASGARDALRGGVRGLYVITDSGSGLSGLGGSRAHPDTARAALEGGARLIQLRDKQKDAGELLPVAREIAGLCAEAGALFIVNDRADLAAVSGADGVHLGQTDLPVPEARKLLGPRKLIGVSVENDAQVRAAEADGADYLGVGAVYGSASKADAGEAVGLEQIRRFRAISGLPIVAIGGITLERAPEAIAAGADAVAVISAVASAPDPVLAARELAGAIRKAAEERGP